MARTPIVATVALSAVVGLIAGCGAAAAPQPRSHVAIPVSSGPQTPRGELISAVRALGRGSRLTATVGLHASGHQVSAVASQLGHPLTTAQARALAGLRLRHERAGASRALDLVSHGTTYLRVIRTQGTYYLRGNLKAALVITGHRDLWRMVRAQRASLPRFVRAFAHGRWISLPSTTAKLIVTALRQRVPLPSAGQIRALIAGVRAALARDVTVARPSHAGRTDHLLLTADAATLSKDIYAVVRRVLPTLAERLEARERTTPTGTVAVRATVTRGVLTALRTNLARLDPHLTTRLPFVIHFRRNGPAITAPRHSTPVDLAGLIGLAGVFSHLGATR